MSLKELLLLLLTAAPPALAGQTPQLVDIGGLRLDVVRAGAGAPAVVFEAGLGDPLNDWDRVWPAVAQFTTVVAYSRSGIGRSEPGPEERTARRAAVELHALLARLRIPPPYVLVGRSYGGILVRGNQEPSMGETRSRVLRSPAPTPEASRDFMAAKLAFHTDAWDVAEACGTGSTTSSWWTPALARLGGLDSWLRDGHPVARGAVGPGATVGSGIACGRA